VGNAESHSPAPDRHGREEQRDPAIPKLLELIEVSGVFISIDAMGCQIEIAETFLKADLQPTTVWP